MAAMFVSFGSESEEWTSMQGDALDPPWRA